MIDEFAFAFRQSDDEGIGDHENDECAADDGLEGERRLLVLTHFAADDCFCDAGFLFRYIVSGCGSFNVVAIDVDSDRSLVVVRFVSVFVRHSSRDSRSS